jgi:hypothetical protein
MSAWVSEAFLRVQGWFARLFDNRISGVPLSIFRIVASILILVDLYQLFVFRHLFFDFFPFVDENPVRVGIVLLAWAVAASFLLVGFLTRVAALVNLVFAITLLGFSGGDYFGTHDMMLLRSAWLLLLMPVSNRLSLDRLRRSGHYSAQADGTVPQVVYFVFAFMIGWIYFDSALWKLDSPMWRAGLGLWAPATLPHAILRRVPFIDAEILMRLIGYYAIVFELSFGLLFTIRRLRPFLIAQGFVFHLGIATMFPIPLFSASTAAFMLPLIPEGFLQRLGRILPRGFVAASCGPFRSSSRLLASWLGSLGPQSDALWPKRWRLVPAATVIALVATSFVITLGAAASPETAARSRVSLSVMRFVYPLTGLRLHRVFADRLFEDYDYQLNLFYDRAGARTAFPFHTEEGFESYAISNRAWEHWWKRTQAPYIRTDDAERNIKRWVQFFAVGNGFDLEDGAVVIEARRQTVQLTEWKERLLDQNLCQPWVRIASVARTAQGRLEIEWNHRQRERSPEPLKQLFAKTVHDALDKSEAGDTSSVETPCNHAHADTRSGKPDPSNDRLSRR